MQKLIIYSPYSREVHSLVKRCANNDDNMITAIIVFCTWWSIHIGLMCQQIPGKASGLNLTLKGCFKFSMQTKVKGVLIKRSTCISSVKINKLVAKSKCSNRKIMLDNTI